MRESWFDGETFTDLEDARRSAENWCREVAGVRVHGTTRQVPREVFESTEKAAMLAAPTEMFDVPLWVDDAKVHPDHHIQVARALYSVPTVYLHKTVRARADKTTVKIYFGTELIKVHPRKPSRRPFDRHERLPGRQGRLCAPQRRWLAGQGEGEGRARRHLRRAHARRPSAVDAHAPGLRAAATLRQVRREGRVEAVCQSALAFDVVDVVRITRMLKIAAVPTVPSHR